MYAKMPEMPIALTTSVIASIRWLMFCGVIVGFFL